MVLLIHITQRLRFASLRFALPFSDYAAERSCVAVVAFQQLLLGIKNILYLYSNNVHNISVVIHT